MTTVDDNPPVWFLPSFWGDIKLVYASDGCILIADKLTDPERQALAALTKVGHKKGWLGQVDGKDVELGEGEHPIRASIDKVAKVIAKTLKPDRKLVSAVVFADGHVQEHVRHEGEAKPDKILPPGKVKRAKAGTTVAAPIRGCPAPDFAQAELKAQRVLESFLSPQQIDDCRRYNRFVSVGHSGRRYMITSRHRRDELSHFGGRTLYDLDDEIPLCVHDWDVPAPEEMLAIHVMVSLPGWEPYVRKLEGEDDDPTTIRGLIGAGVVYRDIYGRDLH